MMVKAVLLFWGNYHDKIRLKSTVDDILLERSEWHRFGDYIALKIGDFFILEESFTFQNDTKHHNKYYAASPTAVNTKRKKS